MSIVFIILKCKYYSKVMFIYVFLYNFKEFPIFSIACSLFYCPIRLNNFSFINKIKINKMFIFRHEYALDESENHI